MKKLGNEKPNAINIATANLFVIVTTLKTEYKNSLLKSSADTVGFCIDDCGALFD